MATKSKATLVAAFVLVSASAVLADNAPYTAEKDAYVRNPNAPVPHFLQAVPVQPRGLIEGRNVGVTNPGAPNLYAIPSEQRHWYDRGSTDFHS